MAPEQFSFPVGRKVFFFKELGERRSWLFLYEKGVDTWGVHLSFLENGLSRGEICFFAWEETPQDVYLEKTFAGAVQEKRLLLHRMRGRTIGGMRDLDQEIDKTFLRASTEKVPLRIAIDLGSLPELRGSKIVSDIVDKIAERRERKHDCISMISVDVDSLDTETLKSLVDSHENLLFSKKTETDFLALGFPSLEEKGPRREVEVVPREALQELAKTHLKTVVFSLLREKPMCGYHLIKSIHRRYHVLISQGTVYPLLYNLTEQGILEVKTQNRFKIYSLTEKGKAFAEDKIRTLLQVHRYAAEVLKTN